MGGTTMILGIPKRKRQRLMLGLSSFVFVALAVVFFAVPYSSDVLATSAGSVQLLARDGQVLRTTFGSEAGRSLWVPLDNIPSTLQAATLLTEDKRFHKHPGIDPLAVGRSLWINLKHGRVVTGGSTVTQQLAGLLWNEPTTLSGKLREAVRAIRLEWDYSKEEILEAYLNRAPYGPTQVGVKAGARYHFGRELSSLTLSQVATLAALPQAPSRFSAVEARGALTERRDRILQKMRNEGEIDDGAYAMALRSPVALSKEREPFEAPHFTTWVLQQLKEQATQGQVKTTLDLRLQNTVEGILKARLNEVEKNGVGEIAAVVQRVSTGEVLALVGSPVWDESNGGQVNGALSFRQPGSALKPFLYGLAFDRDYGPSDLLADIPLNQVGSDGATMSPRNYDHQFHGPVRMREALGSSLNVPAVSLQDKLGTGSVLETLRSLGLPLDHDPNHYGLGLVLGVGETRLIDLVNAYACLARGGVYKPFQILKSQPSNFGASGPRENPAQNPVFSEVSAFLISDILSDAGARVLGFGEESVLDFPFRVAVKTGTSSGYRDSWCVGFMDDVAVGVWAGNFDGSPVEGLAGIHSAAPVFREIVLALKELGEAPLSQAVPSELERHFVCPLSGDLATLPCPSSMGEWKQRTRGTTACTFHGEDQAQVQWPTEYQDWARHQFGEGMLLAANESSEHQKVRVVSPEEGSVFFVDPRYPEAKLRFASSSKVDAWRINGEDLALAPESHETWWTPIPGQHELEIESGGLVDRVVFEVR